MLKKTKIIATMGGYAVTEGMVVAFQKKGLNVARLNFSHGDHPEHLHVLQQITKAVEKTKKPLSILQDLAGPKIRTGDLQSDSVTLEAGKKVILTTQKIVGDATRMSVNYQKLPQDLHTGARILLNDGNQELRVEHIEGTEITCQIVVGGDIKARRGLNLPGSSLSISAVTAKDLKDLAFGIKHNVDFVALSFVQSAKDIRKVKSILQKKKSHALVVAKIETTDAIANLDEIIDATDAVMVARGDLAVEVGPEKVPFLQKEIIARCNALGKPVIVATQMLESMITAPVPTRAEVSDVSNAIIDGADAVMLSAETAVGKYPVQAVTTMAEIACETERNIDYEKIRKNYSHLFSRIDVADAVTRHAAEATFDVDAVALVALTETGVTARLAARYRIQQPIVVVSSNEKTLRQTSLTFGTIPAYPPIVLSNVSETMQLAKTICKKKKLAKKGDKIVILSGSIFGKSGETNTITIMTV